jgi:hypothetical protein
MKTTRFGKLLLVPVVAVICWVVVTRSAPGHQPPAPDPDLEILAKYKTWKLVNPTPELMEPVPAISCGRVAGRDEGSPHLHKYVSVYVNSTGKDAMMKMAWPKYPIGSMIVKEKLGSADSNKPELLTAMIKREAGYNPESGDWEYLVLDGAASEIVERGKLTRCNGCHKAYTLWDFVTRTYLPRDVQKKLKP